MCNSSDQTLKATNELAVLHDLCVPYFEAHEPASSKGSAERPGLFAQAWGSPPQLQQHPVPVIRGHAQAAAATLRAHAGVGGALWRQGYSVEDELRPPMVSRALADKLLRAGKSLNFLRCARPCLHTPGTRLLCCMRQVS